MKVKLMIEVPNWVDRICAWPAIVYRRWKYGIAFRRIYLAGGYRTIVEPEDYYRFNIYEWCAKGCKGYIYAVRFENNCKNGTKTISLHREIMNSPKGLLVDHKNSDTLDNRRANLRLATRFQNGCNSRIDKSNTSSRFRGVTFRKRTGKWVANIRYLGKKIWLGSFDNEIDTARAYDRAAIKYHGEYARLNFPNDIAEICPL